MGLHFLQTWVYTKAVAKHEISCSGEEGKNGKSNGKVVRPRHESMRGEYRHSSTHSQPRHCGKCVVNFTPPPLLRQKRTPVRSLQARWVLEPVQTFFGWREDCWSLQGFKHRHVQPVVWSLYHLSHTDSQRLKIYIICK